MKTLIVFFAALAVSMLPDDHKNAYVCDNGKVHFYASTPLENVEATSKSLVCALNTDTRKVFAKVDMTTFKFDKALMQEHFNENYVESHKYPYANLEANIVERIDFKKDGTYPVTLKGILDLHGVKKPRTIKGTLVVRNGAPYSAKAGFDVRVADHNIKIPTIAIAKIAEVVKVDLDLTFEKYEKRQAAKEM